MLNIELYIIYLWHGQQALDVKLIILGQKLTERFVRLNVAQKDMIQMIDVQLYLLREHQNIRMLLQAEQFRVEITLEQTLYDFSLVLHSSDRNIFSCKECMHNLALTYTQFLGKDAGGLVQYLCKQLLLVGLASHKTELDHLLERSITL